MEPEGITEEHRESLSKGGNHLLSIRDWEAVVQGAEVRQDVHAKVAAKLGRSSFPSVTGFIQARYNGGWQPAGGPKFGVIHSAETPLAPGYAASISNYFSHNTNETSAHFMVGPDAAYQLLDTGLIGWHCGNGNLRSIGVEQAGYAAFGRGQWTTPDGMSQLRRMAALLQEIKRGHGIGLYMMSDQQLRDAWNGRIVGGWATHQQVSRVLGGDHWDPGPNYPFDVLMSLANGGAPPPPTPQPSPGARPPVLRWILPAGHYVGDINGPANCHGGDPAWDSSAIIDLVRNVQQWFVYKGCVPGVSNPYGGWADGRFDRPDSTDAAIRFHARYYPGQPYPDQIWSDDYARLVA